MLVMSMRRAVNVLIRVRDVHDFIVKMSMPTCHGLLCGQVEVIRSARHGCAQRAPDGEQDGEQQQEPDAQDLHDLQSSTGFRPSL